MTVIIALFLAAVVWFIFSVLRIVMTAKRQTRNFFNQFSKQERQQTSRKEGWTRPVAQKPKKIDGHTGEYVEFEEITTTTTTETSATGTSKTENTYTRTTRETQRTESQITDVEWEDI